MAFKIALNPTFKARVEVQTANDKGNHDKSIFMATFKRTDMDELEELKAISQQDVLRRKLVGWSDLIDDQGSQVEYSEETLEAVLKIPEAVHGLSLAFWTSIVKAREKN